MAIVAMLKDPRFQKLSARERRILLEKAGAPAEFVQKYEALESKTPSLEPQQERGVIDKARDFLTGFASDRRINQEERAGLREAGVGLAPTGEELVQMAAMPALPVVAGAAPLAATAKALAVGLPSAYVGGEVARAGGEEIGPGVGDLTAPVGELLAGGAGGAATVPSRAAQVARRGGRGVAADTRNLVAESAKMADQAGRAAVAKVKNAGRGRGGLATELALEGALDTALSAVPGGALMSGVVRRSVRPMLRHLLRSGKGGGSARPSVSDAARAIGSGSARRPRGGLRPRPIGPPAPIEKPVHPEFSSTPPASEVARAAARGPSKPLGSRTPDFGSSLTGRKAKRAWLESRGKIPGAMGPDDVVALKAKGYAPEEIETALIQAAKPNKSVGWRPSPKVGEKGKNWKPEPTPLAPRAATAKQSPKAQVDQRFREAQEGLQHKIRQVEEAGNLKTFAQGRKSSGKGYEQRDIVEDYVNGISIDPNAEYVLNYSKVKGLSSQLRKRVEREVAEELSGGGAELQKSALDALNKSSGKKGWFLLDDAGNPVKGLSSGEAAAAKKAGKETTWVAVSQLREMLR